MMFWTFIKEIWAIQQMQRRYMERRFRQYQQELALSWKERDDYVGKKKNDYFLKKPTDMSDHELLELFLMYIYPQKNTRHLAEKLLSEHESLWSLFYKSSISQQHAGFACVKELCQRFLLKQLQEKPLLNTISKVLDYCHLTMSHLGYETFRVFYLDKKYFLIKEETSQTGTIDEVSLYPRQLMGRALEFQASRLILVHNHPSGDPMPSQTDIETTYTLEKAFLPFKVHILDYIIIGQYQHYSFRENGFLGAVSTA